MQPETFVVKSVFLGILGVINLPFRGIREQCDGIVYGLALVGSEKSRTSLMSFRTIVW